MFNRELLGVNPALAGTHSLADIRVDVTALDRCVARATKDQWIDIRAGGKPAHDTTATPFIIFNRQAPSKHDSIVRVEIKVLAQKTRALPRGRW